MLQVARSLEKGNYTVQINWIGFRVDIPINLIGWCSFLSLAGTYNSVSRLWTFKQFNLIYFFRQQGYPVCLSLEVFCLFSSSPLSTTTFANYCTKSLCGGGCLLQESSMRHPPLPSVRAKGNRKVIIFLTACVCVIVTARATVIGNWI